MSYTVLGGISASLIPWYLLGSLREITAENQFPMGIGDSARAMETRACAPALVVSREAKFSRFGGVLPITRCYREAVCTDQSQIQSEYGYINMRNVVDYGYSF